MLFKIIISLRIIQAVPGSCSSVDPDIDDIRDALHLAFTAFAAFPFYFVNPGPVKIFRDGFSALFELCQRADDLNILALSIRTFPDWNRSAPVPLPGDGIIF